MVSLKASSWILILAGLFSHGPILAQTQPPSDLSTSNRQSSNQSSNPQNSNSQTSSPRTSDSQGSGPQSPNPETLNPQASNSYKQPAELPPASRPEEMNAAPGITIPAGTRVLMSLVSPLHTTSAVTGSGIYLETTLPIIQQNRVAIPAHSQILGVVEADQRPGRVKGRAQFRFRFTNLIFSNDYTVPINGTLVSLPGSKNIRAQDEKGTIAPVDQIDRDVATVLTGAVTGGLIGTVNHGTIRAGGGTLIGAAIGGGLGLAKVWFTRGDEIQLREGSRVEMVLQGPITLEQEKIPRSAQSVSRMRPTSSTEQERVRSSRNSRTSLPRQCGPTEVLAGCSPLGRLLGSGSVF